MDLSGSVEAWHAYEKKILAAYVNEINAAQEAETKEDKESSLIHLLIAFKILGKKLIPYIPFNDNNYLNKLEQYLNEQEDRRDEINYRLPEGWEIRISRKYPGEPYFFRDAVKGRYTEKRVWMGKVFNAAKNSLNLSILDDPAPLGPIELFGQELEIEPNDPAHKGGTYNTKKYVRYTKRRHAKRRQSRRQNRH